MQADNLAERRDLFTKLAHLENQVSKLTRELAVDKKTIQKLQALLAEKQNTISELEAALANAQHTLKDKVLITIQQFQQQLINGIEEKTIKPALQQLQHQVDKIQQLIAETRKVIEAYYQEINNTLLQYVEKTRQATQQKILLPVKTTIDKVATFSREKSAQLQWHVEDRLITSPRESISEFLDDIAFIGKEYLKEFFYQLQKLFKQLYQKIMAMIVNSNSYQSVQNAIQSIRHPSSSEEVYA